MNRIVFGTGPIVLAHSREAARRTFAQRLSEEIDAEVVVVVASTYTELAAMIRRGEAHVAWLPPAVYVRTALESGVELLLSAVRARGSRYRGVIFVRADSDIEGVEGLRGRSVAWVDEGSCAGYLFPRLSLIDRGIDPEELFARQFFAGSHNAVASAVGVGKADAGATFVDQIPENGPDGGLVRPGWTLEVDAAGMRSVLVSDPIPADTICAAASVERSVREDIAAAFATMHLTEEGARALLGLFGVDRFDPAQPESYDIVRRALSQMPATSRTAAAQAADV